MRETEREKETRRVRRGWLEFQAKRNERTAKVSFILISISWCDVYLTTRRRGATSDHFSPFSLSFSLSLASFSFFSVSSRTEIPHEMFYSETPQASSLRQDRNEPLPTFSHTPSPLKYGAQVAATAICIQSTLIREEPAERWAQGHPLVLVSTNLSATVSSNSSL